MGHPLLPAEGGSYLLAALFIVLWFLSGRKKKIVLLEATEAAIIGLAANQLIGLFYFHPRPYMVGLCAPLFPHGPETSFPSDHGTLLFAAAFYLLIARRWTACGIPLLAVGALTAWGRVYTGIHFPFDMAGSLVVGLMSVGLTRLIVRPLNSLNEGLIRIVDQLTGRLVRIKKRAAKEK